MKRILTVFVMLCLAMPLWAQTPVFSTSKDAPAKAKKEEAKVPAKLYDEKINAMTQIDRAIEEARNTNRLVMCQVGGNWCPWCIKFSQFITENKDLAEIVKKHFVYIHVNTSKANKNTEALKRLGNPGRFGYPVLVILDTDGRVLHIQNSSYLEEDKSYNYKKVKEFFLNWTREAIVNLK